MSFFKKIFKAKEGGTLVGNLIRGAASAYTGGLLGKGIMNKAQLAKQARDEVGQAQAQADLQAAQAEILNVGVAGGINGVVQSPAGQRVIDQGAGMFLQRHMAKIIGGVLGLVALVFVVVKLSKK